MWRATAPRELGFGLACLKMPLLTACGPALVQAILQETDFWAWSGQGAKLQFHFVLFNYSHRQSFNQTKWRWHRR
jgi:hypothetical protein